ncbi:serine hydrolase [Amycolatopsis sp. DG1A-15b]|uniref:serine hydrolase n=1 Tax=Amycolatopsis sp. DG1A-15b TaxID=3052846 RepID=UPI00255BEF34|nr:serine hydrolase [Amycolatopsis sp. DG1A-15b]WIX90640.1 serine hydrolase [Amycolatopsis sp. DG1A-15b]
MTTTRRSALGLLGASGALLATGAVAGAASGPAVGPTSVDVRAFDRFVKEQAAVDAFSGSLLLVHRGRPVLARSYGRANAAAPNGPDTLFAMASVTKLFTAVAIAQLAQAGKLAYTSTGPATATPPTTCSARSWPGCPGSPTTTTCVSKCSARPA